jgi:hypothetical protein
MRKKGHLWKFGPNALGCPARTIFGHASRTGSVHRQGPTAGWVYLWDAGFLTAKFSPEAIMMQGVSSFVPTVKASTRLAGLSLLTLMMTGASYGLNATPSKASLKGMYVFQFTGVTLVGWSRTVTCQSGSTKWPPTTVRQQSANSQVVYGVFDFDGAGHVSGSYTSLHNLNQTASSDTIVIECTSHGGVIINQGHEVYFPAMTGTVQGSYSVQADGSGAIDLGAGNTPLEFVMGGSTSTGPISTILLHTPNASDDQSSGIAVHQ